MEAPVRMCLACRARRPQDALVRLGLHDGTVTAAQPARPVPGRAAAGPLGLRTCDAGRPAPRRSGRGAYLCPADRCADAALRKDGAAILRALRLRRGDVAVDAQAIRAVARTGATRQDSSEEHVVVTASRRETAARGACT